MSSPNVESEEDVRNDSDSDDSNVSNDSEQIIEYDDLDGDRFINQHQMGVVTLDAMQSNFSVVHNRIDIFNKELDELRLKMMKMDSTLQYLVEQERMRNIDKKLPAKRAKKDDVTVAKKTDATDTSDVDSNDGNMFFVGDYVIHNGTSKQGPRLGVVMRVLKKTVQVKMDINDSESYFWNMKDIVKSDQYGEKL